MSPQVEDPFAAQFVEALRRRFRRAVRSAGCAVERFISVGGHTVRLRFAGPVLVSHVFPAFEHLVVEAEPNPALSVNLWDSASTGEAFPTPPWDVEDYVAAGEAWGFNDGRFSTISHPTHHTFSLLDRQRDEAIYWVHRADRFPQHEAGSPLLKILHWWMGDHGRLVVHAGAVGGASGGVLLVGAGGSGKSTAALACIDSELAYAGDDYCLVSEGSSPHVYSLYNSGMVHPEDAARLSFLNPALKNPGSSGGEKALYLIHGRFAHKTATSFPLEAILIPSVDGHPRTSLSPASPAAGARALIPSTLVQLRGGGHPARAFRAMTRLVKRMPCYHLELGPDAAEIPRVILGLLARF
jgi:hypothetical protein